MGMNMWEETNITIFNVQMIVKGKKVQTCSTWSQALEGG